MQSEEKIRFEIDEYDRHFVPWNWAIDERIQFVWKTNLLGGGRLFRLIYRLSLLRTLEKFIDEQNNWHYCNGYISQYGKKEDNSKANFLNGKKQIKARTFTASGTYKTEIIPQNKYFWNTRFKELFEPPHIIFKLVVQKTKIPMAFVEEYLCFNSSFVGISVPLKDKKILYELYDRLHQNAVTSKLYQTFFLATSSKALIYHGTSIIKSDFDSLPYPHNLKYLELSREEQIIQNDVLKYYRYFPKSINEQGKELHETISKAELEIFGNLYCELMNEDDEEYNSVGKSLQKWHAMQAIQTNTFTIFIFGYGKTIHKKTFSFSKENGIKDTKLKDIIFAGIENKAIRYNRIVRIYEHLDDYDCVILVKPNTRRYWLQSIAIADVDKRFIDLKKAGF